MRHINNHFIPLEENLKNGQEIGAIPYVPFPLLFSFKCNDADENKVWLEYMQMHTLFLYDSSES